MKKQNLKIIMIVSSLLLSGCTIMKDLHELFDEEEIVAIEKLKETDFDDVITYDVPPFDDTPIALYGRGYLAKVHGKYGFIDNDGNVIIPFQYDRVAHFSHNENITLHHNSHQYPSIGLQYYYPNHKRGDIYRNKKIYAVDVDTNEKYTFCHGKKKHCTTFQTSSIVYPYKKTDTTKMIDVYSVRDVDEYYIYAKAFDKLFGPYRSSEVSCYALQDDEDVYKYYNYGAYDEIAGLLYERLEDGRYRLYNSDSGEVSEQIFDKVTFLSDESAKVYIGSKQGIVDKHCNLVAIGKVENVSEPIQGRTYVKKNGSWALVQLASMSHQKVKEKADEIVEETYIASKIVHGSEDSWEYQNHQPETYVHQLALRQMIVLAKDQLNEEEKRRLKETFEKKLIPCDSPFLLLEEIHAFFDELVRKDNANKE